MEQNFLLDSFLKGGPMMWPLLLCSLLAIGVIIERLWCLLRVPGEEQAEAELNEAENILSNQGEEGAVELFKGGSGVLNFVFAALLKRYDSLILENRTDIEDMRQELIMVTEEAGVDYLGRLLNALGTIGVLSPLMGLLGTILGMIRAFDAIARAGAGDPAAVANGISEALITTASGLIVAIPAIVFHRYLSSRADKVYKNIELYCHAFANTLLVRFQAGEQQQA
ncbi:MAG: MotA/TolQ/ExbB proton channel family protein [Gemmatimonadetes bacterium]|jgi:biopolymer transport protein ExbB|nr:MotA/TolQ/ExbB proton channel family protein [Gemmatimonadota bacterium]